MVNVFPETPLIGRFRNGNKRLNHVTIRLIGLTGVDALVVTVAAAAT